MQSVLTWRRCSRRTNLLQLTFESWADDPEPPASGGDILTATNIKRICDCAEDLLLSTNFDRFCFKAAAAPECTKPYSLCQYMSPTITKSYGINIPAQLGAADSTQVRGAAIGQLFDPGQAFVLGGMDMYEVIQFAPPVSVSVDFAVGLRMLISDVQIDDSATCTGTATDSVLFPDCAEAYAAAASPYTSESCPSGCDYTPGVLTLRGNADYGVCTGWGDAILNAAGDAYSSISFSGCSIPDGKGILLTSDADIREIANSLKDSDDVNAKNYLLTKDFLDGVSDRVPATKMRVFTGIPYNRETFDEVFDLTSKTEDECRAYYNDLELQYENCEDAQFFLASEGPPNKFKTYYDSTYNDDLEFNKEKSEEWWHVLNCGRLLLNYNAQCVEELNKIEQQTLFVPFADENLFPLLNDKMMAGEAPYGYSGADGELRIYYTEFSRLIQQFFDSKVGSDGMKASFAMLFSYGYGTGSKMIFSVWLAMATNSNSSLCCRTSGISASTLATSA